MSFHVGQKVTLMKRAPSGLVADPTTAIPEFGVAYTVRDIDFYQGEEWLRLDEIRNPPVYDGDLFVEPWFSANVFRPIVERKTSISVFTAMLDTSKTKVPA